MFRKTRSQPCFCHSGKALALGSVLLSLLSSPVYAAAWTGAVDNDWFNAGNWSGGVPNAGVIGVIDTTVNAPEITSVGAESATVRVGNTVTGALTVSDGGTLTSTTSHIGLTFGSTGTAVVTGAGSSWVVTPDLIVGSAGTGNLAVSDGGYVKGSGAVYIANQPSGVGTVAVIGVGATLFGGLVSAGNVGTGTLMVSDGGRVTGNNGSIGRHAGSTGTATVTGAGSLWESQIIFVLGQHCPVRFLHEQFPGFVDSACQADRVAFVIY